jgi:hypothetical protein
MTAQAAHFESISLEDLQALLEEARASGANPLEMLLREEPRRLLDAAALPRRFDRRLCESLLMPATGVASVAALDVLIDAGLVQPVVGRPGWFQVNERRRQQQPAASTEPAPWAPGGGRWRGLHRSLALWFDTLGADGEMEALYHRLASGDADGEVAWGTLYDAARDSFDLARCVTLLHLLDECARFVGPGLATRGTRERGLLPARAAFAADHARTSRYMAEQRVEIANAPEAGGITGGIREQLPLQQAFERMVQGGRRFILQLHAPGGTGKTMFLRWLGPRWCLPNDVPIARVDFDFLDVGERALANAFMLGKLAERLDPQLPGAPLFELLRDVAEERRRALSQPELFDAAARQRLEEEVRDRLAAALVEHCDGPVLLVFDTLEDATLKHQVDVLALVKAVDKLRGRVVELFNANHDWPDDEEPPPPPRLVLILSSRYTLAEQYPLVHAEFANRQVVFELLPFGAAESRLYLQRRLTGITQTPRPEVLDAAIKRACGNAFKLSLYADILLNSPTIGVAELGEGVDVDMLYLIERVLMRIPDPALRWVLRYGVLARRLTRDFIEQVLLAPTRRSLRGDRRGDDPAEDGVAHREWMSLWRVGDRPPLRPDEVASLWPRLREYASASSWIDVDPKGADGVVIQPTVSHPMRRALLRKERPVVAQIHRAAIAYARRQVDSTAALVDLTYHDFQLRGALAANAWWGRVLGCGGYGDRVEALASVVLSEDLRESELQARPFGAAPLVDAVTRARALHVLAGVQGARAEHDDDSTRRAQHQAQARAYFEQFDAIDAPIRRRAIEPASDGMLRLRLLGHDARQRDRARQTLEAALAGRLEPSMRGQVLLALQRSWAETDPERARRFGRRWGLLARRQGDPASYAEYAADEARLLLQTNRAAAAMKMLLEARAELGPGQGPWSSRSDANSARLRLAYDEPQTLRAAGLGDAAATRHRQIAGLDSHRVALRAGLGVKLEHAEHLLAAGQAQPAGELARSAAGDIAAAMAPGGKDALTRESGLRLRVRSLLVQAHVARQLLDFRPMLDTLSETLSLHAELGDHFNEVLTRLHIARVHLFDIGNLHLAAEHLQDSDYALATEVAELRIEHRILRAALATFRGRADEGQRLIATALSWLDDVPAERWRVRLHLALAGLSWGADGDRTRHAQALADVWSRFDYAGSRLSAATGLRYLPALQALPPKLAQRLERLTRVQPLRLPGHQRLRPADRIGLTLQRAELLRVIGRRDAAARELSALRSGFAKLPAGLWMRQLALCCDRLDHAVDTLLPVDWTAQLRKALRSAPGLLAAVRQEAAERAANAGDIKRALAEAAAVGFAAEGVPSRWNIRAAELQLFLGETRAKGLPGNTDAIDTARRIDAMRQQLGWPMRELPNGPPPSLMNVAVAPPRKAAVVPQSPAAPAPPSQDRPAPQQPVVPTAILGIRIVTPDTVVRVHHLHNGRCEERRREPLARAVGALLEVMAAGHINEKAAPAVISMLGQRGLQFGRWLAAAVPPMLIERLWAVHNGQLQPQEVVVEHRLSAMHAMPWELMVPGLPPDVPRPGSGDRPLALHPSISRFWRAPALFTMAPRVAWVQRALKSLGRGSPDADGLLGPATQEALRGWQQAAGVPATGWIDEATIAALTQQLRPASWPNQNKGLRVLLITPGRETNIATQRGADASGTSLEWSYRNGGFDVQTLERPDADTLRHLLQSPFAVIHIAAPIAQSRSSRELSLQFTSTHDKAYTTAFSPSLLGRSLRGSPLVVVEAPRSTSRDETIRQLLLRNAFAAQLFEHGELATVVALGLAQPEAQQSLTDTLVACLAERVPTDELVRQLRQSDPLGRTNEDLFELIPSAGIALFARDPVIARLVEGTR